MDKKISQGNTHFIDSIISDLDIQFELNDLELKRIPKDGSFITISNHPFGGIDVLLLIKILSLCREDFKIIDSILQGQYKGFDKHDLPVNPFIRRGDKVGDESYDYALRYLELGFPLGIFPAGEVNSFDRRVVVQDKMWDTSVVKFIKTAQVSVVPIYFHGNRGALLHFLKGINPIFRQITLPKEFVSRKNKSIRVRIGNPISIDVQNEFKGVLQYGRFLRAKTYALGSALEVKRFYNYKLKKQVRQDQIVAREPVEYFLEELEQIHQKALLFQSGKYNVYCTPSFKIPYLMNEIGRLREITFRDVGEGTNRSIDIDEYDLYYEQLFIWDTDNHQVVGAYRVGKGKDIIRQFGTSGFYLNSLFNIKKDLIPVMEKSLELGRSFLAKKYQKNPIALFLLWKGILYLLLKNEEYRYLLGPVSISNNFSSFSKSMIISFIEEYYFHHEFAKFVKPRKKFKVDYKTTDHKMILESVKGDLNKLDKMIAEVEPNHYHFPVLFKKYLKLNARILGFNVDPRFNMALDGLIILDLLDVPLGTIRSLSKELNDNSILERFEAEKSNEEDN